MKNSEILDKTISLQDAIDKVEKIGFKRNINHSDIQAIVNSLKSLNLSK